MKNIKNMTTTTWALEVAKFADDNIVDKRSDVYALDNLQPWDHGYNNFTPSSMSEFGHFDKGGLKEVMGGHGWNIISA